MASSDDENSIQGSLCCSDCDPQGPQPTRELPLEKKTTSSCCLGCSTAADFAVICSDTVAEDLDRLSPKETCCKVGNNADDTSGQRDQDANINSCCGEDGEESEKLNFPCTSSCCDKKGISKSGIVEEERPSGCCGSNGSQDRKVVSQKSREREGDCCETNGTIMEACPCCIKDIVRSVSTRLATSGAEVAVDHLEQYAETLRRCCATLERCCHRACCFVNVPPSAIPARSYKPLRACEVQSTEDLKKNLPVLQGTQIAKAGSTLLQLEIRGMDCVACVPKVVVALRRLPSVTAIETDYFTGIAELRYNPETISPAAIAAYVGRATGFRIKEVTGKDAQKSSHIILPVYFNGSGRPPVAVIDKYDVSRGSSRASWNISFCVTGEGALRPREVLVELEEHGGRLASELAEQAIDPVTHDLWILIVRTTLCAVCTVPVIVFAWASLPPSPVLYGGVSVGLSTIVQFLAAPMYSSSARSILFLHQIDMNVLAGVSVLVSYVFSIAAYAFEVMGKSFSTPFFETCTLLVTLIYIGRTVQAATRKSAGAAIRALHKLQSREVCIVEDGVSHTIASRLLHYGDVVEIFPNTRIVTDGVIISGSSDIDESSVTGESAAVSKFLGNRVVAGTINLNGTLHVQVIKLLHENSISKITQLVRHAQSSRAPLQDLADRMSAIVFPLAVTTAGLTFLVWAIVGVYVRRKTKSEAALDGLMKAIAVLVVSCPCAIGLAVPTVTAVSMRILARSGILVRSADILHTTPRVSVVAFDKTGTLSQGLFSVIQSEVFVEGAEHLVYELVKGDNHPIAQGVRRFLKEANSCDDEKETLTISELSTLPGMGMRATLDGYELLGGNARFTGAAPHATVVQYLTSSLSLFTVTLGGTCLAVYGLSDLPCPEAPRLVESLKRMGKHVVILSGDNDAAVSQFAAKIGVDEKDIHSSCSPEDKQEFIASLQSNHKMVLFVGDGTNDGPALATADTSLAVVSGSEVAQTSAGAILLQTNVERGIMLLFDVASSAEWRSKLSLLWCAVYMVGAIILASGVAVNFRIEPRWAGLGEVVSVLPVVVVGLTMSWKTQS